MFDILLVEEIVLAELLKLLVFVVAESLVPPVIFPAHIEFSNCLRTGKTSPLEKLLVAVLVEVCSLFKLLPFGEVLLVAGSGSFVLLCF